MLRSAPLRQPFPLFALDNAKGASADAHVWLWDVADPAHPRHLATLRAATGQDFAVGFTPDGHHLVAAGNRARLHLWTIPVAPAARRICALAGAPVTRAEWHAFVLGSPFRPPCR